MKTKLTYILYLLLVLRINAQKQQFSIEKARSILFKQAIFAYGFKENKFMVYKLKRDLKLTDSISYDLDKTKTDDYLSIDCDTLHQTLNFYLQKKDKQKATLLRFDTKLQLVNEYKNVDVTKLNPFAAFDHQVFFYKKNCYAVKTVTDSTGKQFYLSKYELQASADKPFDYKFKWQFNFEKRYIKNVNVFYADTNFVLAYVNIYNGERKGQWVLKINATNGLIIKGKKISSNQTINYRYCNFVYDSVTKDVFILGQLTQLEQLSSPTPTVFILQFDSLLNLNNQKTSVQKIAPANPKSKILSMYVVQINHINIKSPQNYEFQIDYYRGVKDEFVYCNSALQQFSIIDETINIEPISMREYIEIDNFLFSQDKKDLCGKLYTDTTKSADRVFYVPPVFKVKQLFKHNDVGLPLWVLKKTDLKTNTINYSFLKPGKKVYETTAIVNLNKEANPEIIDLNSSKFVVCYSKNSNLFQLEIIEW